MMAKEGEIHAAVPGSPEHDDIVRKVEFLRHVTIPLAPTGELNDLANLMTACCMFAGTIFGALTAYGIETDDRASVVAEVMKGNFLAGIGVGKRHAVRAAFEQPGGNA